MADQPNQELPPAKRRRLIVRAVLRGLLVTTVLVVLYYLLPLDRPLDTGTAVRLLIGLLVFVGVTVWQVRAIAGARFPGLRAAETLGFIVPFYLLLFASTYYLMERASAANFTQPLTRTDALYFSVTVFTTVGFGDITAKSETARVVLIVQMLADLALLGAGARVLLGAVRRGQQRENQRRRRPGHQVRACPRPWTCRLGRPALNHRPRVQATWQGTSTARSGPCADGAIPTVLHRRRPSPRRAAHRLPKPPWARTAMEDLLAGAPARAPTYWPGGGAGMRRQCPELAAGQCQEQVTMTAEPPENPVTEGVRSLEVRWIFPGQLYVAVAGWFGQFPAETESRQDTYLLDPPLRGLSVKIRGGRALEVKAYRGSPGTLEVAGRARGRLESWQKWSFPSAHSARTAVTRPAGRRYARDGASADSHRPAGRSWRIPRGRASRGVRWNSPRSTRTARTGGPWASRRPAPPICSAAHPRPPPRSCSPRPCPVGWNLARMNPGPMRNGCPGGPAPRVALTPEDCPSSGPTGPVDVRSIRTGTYRTG